MQHRRRAHCLALATIALAGFTAESAHAGTVAVTGHIQGAGRIQNVDAGPYNCDRAGNVDERVTADCQRQTFGAVFSAWVKLRAVPRTSPAGHWRFAGWQGCQGLSENNQVCEVNSGAFSLDERHPKAIFVDDRAPNVQITDTSLIANRAARISFTTDEGPGDGAALDCRLDGGGWTACWGTQTYSGLSEGLHTAFVRGTDASGQPETEQTSFQIVDTAIASGPAERGFAKSRQATFGFNSGNATGYECALTQSTAPGGWQACPPSYSVTVPADGEWRLFVRARNGAFIDPEPAARTWIVDTVAPLTTLDATVGPRENAVQASTSEKFAFGADEPADRYECKLDAGAFEPCTSPRTVSGLAVGAHAFSVRAVDRAGNTGAATVRNWRVAPRDDDGDGFASPEDCDDANAAIGPARADVPDNGVDEDCDGHDAADMDRDRDGVLRPADCNDGNAGINATRRDVPENGVDENCDGSDASNPDRDGDGHDRPGDCRDDDAAIHPGVRDVPGNGVDENCDGKDDTYASVGARLSWRAKVHDHRVRFQKLAVQGVPAGSTTRLSCTGPRSACPIRVISSRGAGTIDLAPKVRRLPAGTVIEIRVTHADMIGTVFRFKTRRTGSPQVATLCLAPGATTPKAC